MRIVLIFFLMICSTSLSTAARQAEAPRSWCVSAWYPSAEHPGGYESLMTNRDVIDEVNPFWYAAASDGTLTRNPGAEDTGKLAAWREAGQRVLPTIANASPLAISTPETRAFHITQIVDLVETWDYDGIDIDYEEFPLDTRDDFSTFIEELAERLHANGRLLTIAVHAKFEDRPAYEAAAAQDWARLGAVVDVFRIMTYDYHSRTSREPGPVGPPGWSADVLAYAASLMDLGKVRLGLHFYGYRWQRGSVAVVTWESVQHTLDSFKLVFERDPQDMEARLVFKAPGLPQQTIYVADSVGLVYKLDHLLAAYPDLGGVSIWGLGGEDPANWDVLRETRAEAPCEF